METSGEDRRKRLDRMRLYVVTGEAGGIEETVIPRNPLDVLAQQIVAIAAEEEISVDDLHELVRGAYTGSAAGSGPSHRSVAPC